jgi:hypothetical protein
MKAIE